MSDSDNVADEWRTIPDESRQYLTFEATVNVGGLDGEQVERLRETGRSLEDAFLAVLEQERRRQSD
jgi:hypothetical protein